MSPLRSAAVLFLLAALASAPAAGADECLKCHAGLGGAASRLFRQDVHRERGVTCAGCHGGNAATGDMVQAMDPDAGFVGVPAGDTISERCAACHADAAKMKGQGSRLPTDQMALLRGSVHGKLSTSGKERIAQCTTCHGAHGVAPVKDRRSPVHPLNVVATCASCHNNAAYMRAYNPALPVDQLEKYRTSVHGRRNAGGDVEVAECASCHGSHDVLSSKDVRAKVYPTNIPATCAGCHSDAERMKPYGIATDQYAKYAKSVHGVALLERSDIGAPACNSCHGNHGATPPGVESISKVCGTCHALNAELFSASPHKAAFDEQQLPECETCHGNHEILAATNELLGTSGEAVCSTCHSATENAKGYRVAGLMRSLIDSLVTREARAAALVEEAEQKGMEVADAKFKLRDARQARLESRTMVHAFDEARFREVVDKGFATVDVVTAEGQRALDEFVFRRTGLLVSTFVITGVAVALYLFIRRLERRQANQRPV